MKKQTVSKAPAGTGMSDPDDIWSIAVNGTDLPEDEADEADYLYIAWEGEDIELGQCWIACDQSDLMVIN